MTASSKPRVIDRTSPRHLTGRPLLDLADTVRHLGKLSAAYERVWVIEVDGERRTFCETHMVFTEDSACAAP